MISRVLCCAAGVFLLSEFGLAQTPQPPTKSLVFLRMGVTVPTTLARKELTQGSGFLIDSAGHILTARHVALHREREEPGERWWSAFLVHKDSTPIPAHFVHCEGGNVDLCLLKISEEAVTASNISEFFTPSCRKLFKGEKVVALGYPSATGGLLTVKGEVNGALVDAHLAYPSNVGIQPGMSGGPVLDEQGRVVAVSLGATQPTLTFVQPLGYGVLLFTRTGASCSVPNIVTPLPAPSTMCEQSKTSELRAAAWNSVRLEQLYVAEKLARDLLACDPTDWQAHNVLGAAAFLGQRYDKAVESFESALKYEGIQRADVVSNLADSLVEYAVQSSADLKTEMLRKAIKLYSWIQHNPKIDNSAEYGPYRLARAHLLIGEPLIAIKEIRKVNDKYGYEAAKGKARILQGAIHLEISKISRTEYDKNIALAEGQFIKGFRMDSQFWRNIFSLGVLNRKEPFGQIVTIYDGFWQRWVEKHRL
jgi:hypothetical protein